MNSTQNQAPDTMDVFKYTGTTNLIDAYAELCDCAMELESAIEASFNFSPAVTGRVAVLSRRDVMEQGIRAGLRATLATLHNHKAVCSNALGWENVERLHYYGA